MSARQISKSEKLKNLKLEINIRFPKVKISARKDNHSGLHVRVISADFEIFIDKSIKSSQISKYIDDECIGTDYTQKGYDLLRFIIDEIHQDVKYYETADYGTQPSFYLHLSVGNYDKPFEVIK